MVLRLSACRLALLLGAAALAHADPATDRLPEGGQVVRGEASLVESGARLDVRQSSERAVIDWNSFSIGRDATVSFSQPSADAVALNRVLSSDPSEIFGRLLANGRVFLSNPNGVLFGSEARVDVGGVAATTMQVGLDDFMAGRYRFTGGRGSVVNRGLISASGGLIALMAPEVRNEGVLSARLGIVALAAGEAVTLQLDAGSPVSVQVDPATVGVLLENRSLIEAPGGQVLLSASAAERLLDGAIPGAAGASGLVVDNGGARLIDMTGTIRASRIAIDGGDRDVTRVAGTLEAPGGEILVTGGNVLIDSGASLDASGDHGGTVLVGGGERGEDPGVRNADRVFIAHGATLAADGGRNDSQSGAGGRVIVYSSESSEVAGQLSARGGALGGNGGFIETSGGWLAVDTVPDATAPAGAGGTWLIDPFNITIQAGGSDSNIGSSPTWQSTANDATLRTSSIENALNTGTNVTISTGGGGAQGGDITIADPITKIAGNASSIAFFAHRDIVVNAPISSTGNALSLSFNADTDSDFAGAIVVSSNLTTRGGSIDFLDGTVVGGNSAITFDTSGGSGGAVTFAGQVMLGNSNGVNITTGGGNVQFQSLLDSGNSYALISPNVTWNAALAAAASGSGLTVGDTYLATITSPLEMARAAATANYAAAWLGGSDSSTEGTWRWVTGPEGHENGGLGRIFSIGNRSGVPTALTGYNGTNGAYVNWNAGEPNDSGGEDALQLGFGAAGQWNDLPTNSSTLPYVRETVLAPSPLTISAGSGSITFDGDVGTNKALGTLTLTNSGLVNLNANTVNVFGDINLNAGGNVVLGMANSPTFFADDGNINVNRNFLKNAGTAAALELRADGDVRVQSGADITSTVSTLSITLNSDRDNSGVGAIAIGSGSVLTSNGGDITLRGGSAALGAIADPTSDAAGFLTTLSSTGARGNASAGIDLSGATLTAGGGRVELRGVGANGQRGVQMSNGSSITTTGTGAIAIHGAGGATLSGSDGVRISESGNAIATQTGELRVQGLGRGGDSSQGIEILTPGTTSATTLTTVNGNLVLRGVSTATGVSDQGLLFDVLGSARTTGSGNVDVIGRAGGTAGGVGVHLQAGVSVSTTGGGDLSLTGYGSTSGTGANNEGVKVDASLVEVQSGGSADLSLVGTGGTGTSFNVGVNVRVGSTVRMGATAGGQMTITGTGGNGSVTGNWGVLAEADGIYESLGSAPIVITGVGGTAADNHGIRVTGGSGNRIGSPSMTGAITLIGDTMDLEGSGVLTVQSSGALSIQPFSSGTGIGLGNGASGLLNLNATELSRFANGFSQITIGRTDGTGAINVTGASLNDNLRLLNTGGGSAGIGITGALSLGSNDLWLSSNGAVTQTAGVTASRLLLTGAGAFTLANATNSVGTLAGLTGGAVSFVNNGSFSVGSIVGGVTTFNGVDSGGAVSLQASGASADLTLLNQVSATGTGTTVQLAAGDQFLNSVGAGAIDADLGRWLVWSANPMNDTRGGLVYGFKQYAATFGVTAPAQPAGNGFLYSLAPSITASLIGTTSRVYDGTTAASLTGANFTSSGAIDGDTVVVSTPTSGTFDTKNVGAGKTVTATGLSVSGATNGAATVYGYQLASSSVSAAIGEITQRTLTAGLTGSVSKVYDGTNAASLSTSNYTLTGVLGADAVTLNNPAAGTYNNANVGTGKAVTVTGLALSGGDSGNYVLASSSAVASVGSITTKVLTVTANDAVRLYGDANPAFSAGYSGFVTGEGPGVLGGALSLATGATITSNVGSYAITPSGLTSSNYALTFVPGTLTVNPAPLTVTAEDKTKVYGSADPALTLTIGGSGLRNGDTLSGALSAPTGASATAGTHAIVQGTIGAGSNYTLSFTPGTLLVTQSPLSVTADDKSKTYGGSDPALTMTIGGSGLHYGDTLSGALAAPTGAGATAGTHAILQGTLAANSNYSFTFTPGTLQVAQSPLLVTADDKSKTYGDADPALTVTIGGSGLHYGDTLTGALTAPTGATATAGTHAILQGTLAASSNYSLSFTPGTLQVGLAPLLITADDQTKVYGDADPTLTMTVGGAGLHYGDSLTGALTAPAGAAATAGTHAILQGTVSANSNYSLIFTPGILHVARAPLLITADDQSRLVFEDNPPLTATVSGLRYDDDRSVISGLNLSTAARSDSAPGEYAIVAAGGEADNYSITHANGTLAVSAQSANESMPVAESVARVEPVFVEHTPTPAFSGTTSFASVIDGGVADGATAGNTGATLLSGGFLAVEKLDTIGVPPGSSLEFELPADTFRHSDSRVVISITVYTADGSPLPSWLRYDAAERKLRGFFPFDEEETEVLFVARDDVGGEARTVLRIRARN